MNQRALDSLALRWCRIAIAPSERQLEFGRRFVGIELRRLELCRLELCAGQRRMPLESAPDGLDDRPPRRARQTCSITRDARARPYTFERKRAQGWRAACTEEKNAEESQDRRSHVADRTRDRPRARSCP